jgi:hypothetical protein
VMISCATSGRAGAVGLLYLAKLKQWAPEQALSWAQEKGIKFLKDAAVTDWVIAALYRISCRRPPLFRQLMELESSTYTYILADPQSE